MNPNLASGFGYDFGRSGDLSVCAVLQEDAGLNLKTAFVLEIRNMPHEQQWQIADYITSHLPLSGFPPMTPAATVPIWRKLPAKNTAPPRLKE